MDILWPQSLLRIEWGNTYRSIDQLCDEITRLWEDSHEQFYNCLLRLFQLHREFYRIAVQLLLIDGAEDEYIRTYKGAIREEQKKFIELLRWLQRQENIVERIFREKRVQELVWFLEGLVDDIIADWKIEEWTNELIYYPDD
jgi:hypothetical protein